MRLHDDLTRIKIQENHGDFSWNFMVSLWKFHHTLVDWLYHQLIADEMGILPATNRSLMVVNVLNTW